MNSRGWALACLGLLGACATVPPRAPPPADRDLAALAAFDHWQAQGRLAVRTAQDGFSAHFDWRQAGPAADLGVRGPFGAGAARITIGLDRIRIESGSEAPLEVPAPYEALEPLLSARLGFPLPLIALRYWLVGVPAPGPDVAPAAGGFEQAGWRVTVSDLRAVAQAPGSLPGRLELTRGSTRIRVLVDRWLAGAP